MQSAAVPALTLALADAVLLWTTRHAPLALDKGQSLAIRMALVL